MCGFYRNHQEYFVDIDIYMSINIAVNIYMYNRFRDFNVNYSMLM